MPTLAHCPCLLVQITFTAPTLPFPLGGGTSSSWSEPCLCPSLGAIYTSKAQGEKSDNLHMISESNKQQHCPRGLPKPFWPAGSWASSQSRLPCEAPSTLTFFFLPDTNRGLSPRWQPDPPQHLQFSVRGAEPRWGYPSVPPYPPRPRSLRDHPIRQQLPTAPTHLPPG